MIPLIRQEPAVARGGLRILQLDDFDLLDLLDAAWHGRDPNWHWLLSASAKPAGTQGYHGDITLQVEVIQRLAALYENRLQPNPCEMK